MKLIKKYIIYIKKSIIYIYIYIVIFLASIKYLLLFFISPTNVELIDSLFAINLRLYEIL